MIDVSNVILNFQKLLISISNSLFDIGLYKDSDEWEELTERAFNTLVVGHLKDKFGHSLSVQYEVWNRCNIGLIVRVNAGGPLLIGERDLFSENTYSYKEIPKCESGIEFSFVEFGNPLFNADDIVALEYAFGFDSQGRLVCARKDICGFLIKV
ncbi:hypothetical protein [Pseudoalteromonas umbrosa]|uniref:hypothetical protein n=1 Tax=Pseudoalteromonas umbrosa TaxID=3048489 RepID=UPI0024C26B3C|nr:hypothetical protein [Pseudoalteromonas sp. B95]MDK1288393.1 hypothetical protein [Pseudoalteromonas sp. B95]